MHRPRSFARFPAAAGSAALASLAFILAALLAGSCSEPLAPNRPPSVTLSAEPVRDSASAYLVTFMWDAFDPDGEIARFLYAVDDTMPGSWLECREYEITLVCTATQLAGVDSIRIGTTVLERYRFRDAHTFYLKAVDDDGAESPTVSVSFTAETIAPETEILTPLPTAIVLLGPSFRVAWAGRDLDGTGGPLQYAHRAVPVANVITMSAAAVESVLFDPAGEPWSPFAEETSIQLELAAPQDYVFGVVARDEAGAVEPRLRTSSVPGPTNAIRIRARARGGVPDLWVTIALKTVRFPTANEPDKIFRIPGNTDVLVEWEGDASRYGGRIAGYSYGIDLADPYGEDPGWSAEDSTTQATIRLDLPAGASVDEVMLYVRARDEVGGTTIADADLIVMAPARDRDLLYVDDFPDVTGRVDDDCIPPPPGGGTPSAHFPHDRCHDQLLQGAIARALAALGHPEWIVDRYEPLDPNTGRLRSGEVVIDSTSFDSYWVYSGPVILEHLLRYRAVIWNVSCSSHCQLAAMNREGEENALAAYLEAGGDAWLMGIGTFSQASSVEWWPRLPPFGIVGRGFIARFLKVEPVIEAGHCVAGCFGNSGRTTVEQRVHGFEGAYAHAIATAEGYPALRVAREPFAGPEWGVPCCEGMLVPFGYDANPRLRTFGGRLDTLYFYESNSKVWGPPPVPGSFMDDAACALRYAGPEQGRLMMFGFPLYFMPVNEVDQVMRASLDWLLQ